MLMSVSESWQDGVAMKIDNPRASSNVSLRPGIRTDVNDAISFYGNSLSLW
jgi:hypothetical protein